MVECHRVINYQGEQHNVADHSPPNMGMEPTPLRVEQARCDFDC
jgi:hypothetical protein